MLSQRASANECLDSSYKNDLLIRLQQIEKALERLEAGNYGFCQLCHGEIQEKRLNLLPFVELCINCQKAKD